MSPLTGRLIYRLVPWHASVVSGIGLILSQAIQTGAGGVNIAAVVIATLGLDLFKQSEQVSLTTAVFQYTWFGYEGGIEPRMSVIEERKGLQSGAENGDQECVEKGSPLSRTVSRDRTESVAPLDAISGL